VASEITPTRVLIALEQHLGRDEGASAAELVRQITGDYSPAQERALRQAIVDLRLKGWHICGHPAEGYYIAETEEELSDTCLFLYDRAMTSLTQISAMKHISLPDLRGQLKLPT